MLCRITDLHQKEVINVCDGHRLGCVDDVEIDTCTAQLVAIVIRGRAKMMGLAGRQEDIVIGFREIEVIGDETVLVRLDRPYPSQNAHKGRHILGAVLGG
jgi:YlmC/YmxH family sporulation protein